MPIRPLHISQSQSRSLYVLCHVLLCSIVQLIDAHLPGDSAVEKEIGANVGGVCQSWKSDSAAGMWKNGRRIAAYVCKAAKFLSIEKRSLSVVSC